MSRLLFSVSEFNSNGVVLNFGGNFNDQNPNYGLFYLNGNNRASDSNNNVGARQLVSHHCADFRSSSNLVVVDHKDERTQAKTSVRLTPDAPQDFPSSGHCKADAS